MKKKNLFLLAGLTAMLTGCFGTKYTNESKESDNTKSIEKKETLSLASRDKGEGKFTLTIKNTSVYEDGTLQGFLGIGKVEGKVEHKETITQSGTWTINNDTNVVTLTTLKVVVKAEFDGDGAEDYKDIKEPEYAVVYGEDNAQLIIAGEKVTIEYSADDAMKTSYKLDETNKTFKFVLF